VSAHPFERPTDSKHHYALGKADCFSYSTCEAHAAPVMPKVLTKMQTLLVETRKIAKFVRKPTAKAVLLAVARHHEPTWNLSEEAKPWCRDKMRELKNMLRHVQQAAAKTSRGTLRH
jgi:hypothetical protein